MTEAEWLTCTDPGKLLEFLRNKASDRKLRLVDIAGDIAAGLEGKYVAAFERHADGTATKEDEWLLGNDWTPAWESAYLSLGGVDCNQLRCIFGNPFKPITIDPAWRTSTVTDLAAAIYDDRAFNRLPILADALEEAGCTSQDILNHCRQPGVHVRGCWTLDLLLGKE